VCIICNAIKAVVAMSSTNTIAVAIGIVLTVVAIKKNNGYRIE
jgi:hypothetical protein